MHSGYRPERPGGLQGRFKSAVAGLSGLTDDDLVLAGGLTSVVPYSLEVNDTRFWRGGINSPGDFFETLKNTFDTLYREGDKNPKMMSVGLHCRNSLSHPPRQGSSLARGEIRTACPWRYPADCAVLARRPGRTPRLRPAVFRPKGGVVVGAYANSGHYAHRAEQDAVNPAGVQLFQALSSVPFRA